MINQAEINKKAMQDIFAMDEAVGQFESFGSQLDLGLPPVEDDAPKSFEDMLDVNPSNEPSESGEYFMNEGDDLQDTATQKFVVDEFAKELMKCDDTISVQDRLPDIAAYIQGTNNIKGDVQSFLRNTIERATAFQQAQNVSDAQPNGVADPNAQPVDAAPVDGMMADPMAEGIPTMEPIDPTAEPSLEPNPEPADPLTDLASEPEPEDPLAGLDGLGDDLGLGDEEAPAEGEPAAEDEGDDLADLLGGEGGGDAEATGDEAATADEEAPVDGEPASDEGEDGFDDEAPAEDTEDKSDDKSDDDADFDFESIAKKAHGLVEGVDGDAETTTEESDLSAEGQAMGETQAESDFGDGGDDAPVTECGEQPADEQPADEIADKKAQVESIARQCRLRMTAEKAKKLVESYQDKRARANTIARLESVVGNLRKKAQTESIIEKFAKESKAAAAKPVVESTTNTSSSKFNSLLAKADRALNESVAADRMKAAANKVIAEFEASTKLAKDIDAIVESAANSVKTAKAKVESVSSVKKELDSILEGVAKKQEASKMDADLAKIVAEVKKS